MDNGQTCAAGANGDEQLCAEHLNAFSFTVTEQPTNRRADSLVEIGETRYENGAFVATATYLHDGSENFEDQFSYRANDGELNSNISVADIVVGAINEPPIVYDLPEPGGPAIEGVEGGLITVTLTATDVDTLAVGNGDTAFRFEIVAPPAGLVADDVTILPVQYDLATRTFTALATYTHSGAEAPFDTFTYRATDGAGCPAACVYSDEAAVTIQIDGLDDKPFINNNTAGADAYEDSEDRAGNPRPLTIP